MCINIGITVPFRAMLPSNAGYWMFFSAQHTGCACGCFVLDCTCGLCRHDGTVRLHYMLCVYVLSDHINGMLTGQDGRLSNGNHARRMRTCIWQRLGGNGKVELYKMHFGVRL